MKSLWLILRLYGFWFAVFWVVRGLFIAFNLHPEERGLVDIWHIYKNAFALDLSSASYFVILTMVVVLIGQAVRWIHTFFAARFITVLLAILYLIIGIADLRLYHYWGFKLDITLFRFLEQPTEAMASVQGIDILIGLVAGIITGAIIWLGIRFILRHQLTQWNWKNSLIGFFLTVLLIIPMRGGIGVATIGLSSAYYSTNVSQNHAAVNTFWNLTYSVLNRDRTNIVLSDSPEDENETFRQQLYSHSSDTAILDLPEKTNVVLIVLESFTARLIEAFGGADGVTPNLNRYAAEGLIFTNFYSSGDRSDKGLSSLYTGFPALPEVSITFYPDKVQALPNLYSTFANHGYSTTFSYGGDLEFANISTLFKTAKSCRILDEEHFSATTDNIKGKWGIHDAYVMRQSIKDIQTISEPFFSSIYTLSSHEPFDIPEIHQTFEGDNAKCYKAAWYTDSCLGIFLDSFRKTDKWKRTLVIITADHGIRQPDRVDVCHPEKYRIPLVFTGGVIQHPDTITTISSHTDLPYTIGQEVLHFTDQRMLYSKSLFSDESFAYYFYQVGCGRIDDSTALVFDFPTQKVFYREPKSWLLYEDGKREINWYAQSVADHFNHLR
ncbi:MAG: sulfatase-like hydrolase/transferase [Flavobacteriales bacterium]|nr:sulfatase-like hydrolase/transferase [Bacteroidota bacterium]MCB9240101.1 sulfatase-like hydrolase/transferase [Flavobacteriales bacterium]